MTTARETAMELGGVRIDETFAEAFSMVATRAVITAETSHWALLAARQATGYASSIISCDCEAGIETRLRADQTPDGRPGVTVLFFSFNRDKLQTAVANRIGQCVMTCATTACYNGLEGAEKMIRVGGTLRYFGDGFQTSKLLEMPSDPDGFGAGPTEDPAPPEHFSGTAAGRQWVRRRFWRVPVMDGEFLCEDRFGTIQGVAGGNLIILAETQAQALEAAERAVEAIDLLPEVVTPFPGGIVRSGSKVGSKYKKLRASTNDAYCPTLRGITDSELPDSVGAVYEIVIDGLSLQAVEQAMRVGIRSACRPGVVRISAGNYGGNLGPHHIHLHSLLDE